MSHSSYSYRYNSSGALTRDLNRGLKSVTYDNLNRPVKLTFSSASYIDHVYAVDGTRLRTIHNTSLLTGTVVPIQRAPILRPLFTRDTVEYSGPVVYENGKVKRVMFEGGYATFDASGVPGWHYFVCDHAGSVRTVVDMWARAEQINHYYPYGLTFADAGKAPDHQPCKFGGKELDAMYGLHFHDFHARLQIPDLGRFDRPDPLADKYPHLSPYLFCANDPVNLIDDDGREVKLYATRLPGNKLGGLTGVATHTFITVTTSSGELKYYAYGSEYDGARGAVNGHIGRQKYRQDKSIINGSNKDPKLEKAVFVIDAPEGMSQDEFDNKVIQTAESFGDLEGIDYFIAPLGPTLGNCNTSSYTILKKSGVSDEVLNEIGENIPGISWGFGMSKPWTKEEQENALNFKADIMRKLYEAIMTPAIFK